MSGLKTLHQMVHREQYMLNQFCNNLQTVIHRLMDKEGASVDGLQALDQRLKDEASWPSANHVELALVDHYNDTLLMTEWRRRLAEVERLPRHLAAFYGEHAQETDIETVRTLLSRIIADLQWVRESKRVIRVNESQMRRKTVALFLFGFILFFSPTLLGLVFSYEFDNLRLYYIFTAATSGILGAAFSQLTSIQSRVQHASLDQVRAMSQLGYIVARAMVGAGAGLIMFYLVQSGLLSGAFFPEFIHEASELAKYQESLGVGASSLGSHFHGISQKIESALSVGTLARPAQGLSLLIVWCLLAGFSEKLIPGILNNKAKELEDSSAK